MEQYTIATFDLLEAVAILATLRANGTHATLTEKQNAKHTYPVMEANKELDNYQNWEASYGTPFCQDYMDKITHPVEKDLVLNYTSAWFNSNNRELLKKLKKDYFEKGIIPELTKGFFSTHFPMRKEDYFKLRPDQKEPNSFTNTWTAWFKPLKGIPYKVPSKGVSYGVYISDVALSAAAERKTIELILDELK